MDKSALKKYAPQARLDFIAAVTRRAEALGLNPKSPADITQQGDALIINGRAYPASYAAMRKTLIARIKEQGFAVVMEAMAYTWFNRFVAIRYMEVHNFLDHGYRVLSHPANAATGYTQPEILDHIADLDLPGLNKRAALDLKLAGNRDEDLYREVLLAQCHALHTSMPFLFEFLDDATELLLPDGLLRTDSLLAMLVTKIGETDWQEVEIIGWLYQFYISEKKDQVIGKVVKSEDIPAATQLFTPNWIVKYLVQNSLGRLWLMANPTSQLASQWEYYIKPAEQTPVVNAQLDALIQARIEEDGATLNPESLSLLDPACGSGHILVEAYDLLRDIYLERGYRRQDIPRLILEKNLYGLDIDERAAQLAGFALLMKARADDRRLLDNALKLNVLALQQSKAGSAADLHSALHVPEIDYALVHQLIETFEQAKTLGSLITVPHSLASKLPELTATLKTARDGGDLMGVEAARNLLPLVGQAAMLANKFDAVVVNPPYLGSRAMETQLKEFVVTNFPNAKSDTFAAFISRSLQFSNSHTQVGFVTPYVWMFLSSYEALRRKLVETTSITSMVKLEYNAFEPACVPVGAFTFCKSHVASFEGRFIDLSQFRGHESQPVKTLEAIKDPNCSWIYNAKPDKFLAIPGSVIAFWLPEKAIKIFADYPSIKQHFDLKQGLATGENAQFLRLWYECDLSNIAFNYKVSQSTNLSSKRWFPCQKGGGARKWYGNNLYIIDWEADGRRIKNHPGSVIRNPQFYYRSGATWGSLTISALTMRYVPSGSIFESKGAMAFPKNESDIYRLIGYSNSKVMDYFLKVLAPTLDYSQGPVGCAPFPADMDSVVADKVKSAVQIARNEWDSFELSWDFIEHPFLVLQKRLNKLYVHEIFEEFSLQLIRDFDELHAYENELGSYFANCLDISDIVDSNVDREEIDFRLVSRKSVAESTLSYAIGCMMGRYSLDAPGLIYAQSGNEGFDPSCYGSFPADDDGIVPITDEAWFDDDAANRIREFVGVVWGSETEMENFAWFADSFGNKRGDSQDDIVRKYLSTQFYKDHLQTYKKRPIYWLFSSGKHKAFECLVYLHRYNTGTLSRMRMEYVVPLQSKMQARIENLNQDIASSTSSSEQKRFQKQKDKLIKQLDELRRFDENLRHYADQRITLDLDDGVKVNYGKFGDLLAEVKAVTGTK